MSYKNSLPKTSRNRDSVNADPVAASVSRLRGLRANSLAVTVIVLIEYSLGIWVNLYADLPAADHGANIATGFTRAISNGPVALSIHALVGIALIASAISAVVRSVLVHQRALTVLTSVGLVAILVAAASGSSFVGHRDNPSSMAMAIAAAVAIGSYAIVLFVSGSRPTPVQDEGR